MLKQIVFYTALIIIVVEVFLVILRIWRKRKSKKIVNEEIVVEKVVTINFTIDEENDYEQSEDKYKSIVKQIRRVKKYKSILFTSAEAGTLPVTIPVNTAIELAKIKQRCLLIDLDLKRDAIAKVFGLSPEQSSLSPKSIQTEFENLWVWPGHKFSQSKQMNLTEIVEKGLNNKSPEKFDFILINAPALVNNLDRKQIISAAQAAFICTKETSDRKKLDELIDSSNCRVIGEINMLQ